MDSDPPDTDKTPVEPAIRRSSTSVEIARDTRALVLRLAALGSPDLRPLVEHGDEIATTLEFWARGGAPPDGQRGNVYKAALTFWGRARAALEDPRREGGG